MDRKEAAIAGEYNCVPFFASLYFYFYATETNLGSSAFRIFLFMCWLLSSSEIEWKSSTQKCVRCVNKFLWWMERHNWKNSRPIECSSKVQSECYKFYYFFLTLSSIELRSLNFFPTLLLHFPLSLAHIAHTCTLLMERMIIKRLSMSNFSWCWFSAIFTEPKNERGKLFTHCLQFTYSKDFFFFLFVLFFWLY